MVDEANFESLARQVVDVPLSESCDGGKYSKRVTAMHLRNLSSSTHTEIDDYCDSEWHAPAFEAYDTLFKETPAADDIKSLVTIEADSNLSLSDVHELLDEYSDIFSETLKAEPALVPPLELTVDKQMWEQPKHHSAPRAQTSANQAEIKIQLD